MPVNGLPLAPFLLTRLLRGATKGYYSFNKRTGISTHTPLARRDKDQRADIAAELEFLLTRLLRGATEQDQAVFPEYYISTHTPLARRDDKNQTVFPDGIISTHTPLARRDTE